MDDVKVWIEQISIPTYCTGSPEKNPIFLEKRVYQGSSGSVYPLPIIEKIMDEKTMQEWKAVFIENKYIKLMILPELGGRIQMAFDKLRNRHFIYYNHVIKPALVGLTGPWISGGIEFNWPQHHRPGTFDPVNFNIEENPDGRKTVWCSELERLFRTRGMAGITLYPDKAYFEVKVKLYNRTPHPQTFLWWANVAVFAGNDYQSVFPPDVNAVFDHGKRDVSSFPIARGTYYKVDYSRGVDISRYKNIPVPTSFMAAESIYDFLGGYENDTEGGFLYVADHHLAPGKKQWTWGNGDFGIAWDRNLTDNDGPYVELMCGAYTDNQPDFSWLMPYEEKSFSQYFMPYFKLGVVKNATKDALVSAEVSGRQLLIKAYCTSEFPDTAISLICNGEVVFKDKFNFTPAIFYDKSVNLDVDSVKHLELLLSEPKGRILVKWNYPEPADKKTPEPAKPALDPSDINSIEDLYLTGLHLEQYRHATFNPVDYYSEALKREPTDIRCNNALGLWWMRRGQLTMAETYFRNAVLTSVNRNPNPLDGEPFYNLGTCLRYQGRYDEAYDAFYKCTWNAAWQDAGYFNLALLETRKGNYDIALEMVSKAIRKNYSNHKARHLEIVLLRKLNRLQDCLYAIDESLLADRLNLAVCFEQYLATNNSKNRENLILLLKQLKDPHHALIEYSIDYADAGLYNEGIELLQITGLSRYPMVHYLSGWYASNSGNSENSKKDFVLAASSDPSYCFPNRIEEYLALCCAADRFNNSMANYYLGNFLYAFREYESSIQRWEQALIHHSNFPTIYRNLALAYYNREKDPARALGSLEKAFYLNVNDHRVMMELDQLYKKQGRPFSERIEFIEKYTANVEYRDDLYLEKIILYNLIGKPDVALSLLMKRNFHPWEGGEGKVTGQFLISHIQLAKNALLNCECKNALAHLSSTDTYPENLGEGKLASVPGCEILFWKGCAYMGLKDNAKAIECWEMAGSVSAEPASAIFYNDQPPENVFYKGLALLNLDRNGEANGIFQSLIDFGETHINDAVRLDYFAVSLPDMHIWNDDPAKRNRVHCNYMAGLGYLGKGMTIKATGLFKKALEIDIYHTGCNIHLAMCNHSMQSLFMKYETPA